MVNENERQQSEFNMAVGFLNRLNTLLYFCNEYSIELDSHKWFHFLSVLLRELSTEMTEDEYKKGNGFRRDLNEMVNQNIKKNLQHGTNQIPQDTYEKLHNFEVFLRNVLKDSGLLTKMKEDAASALK